VNGQSPSNKIFQESREAAQKKIQECKNGIFVSQRKANVEIENVGSVINSRFIDYGAVVTPDESTLYFTTTRPGAKGEKDEAGHYPEDIYVSYNENGKWGKPRNIGAPINTEEYESILTVAQEGRKMIFFRQDDLLQSFLGDDGKWSEPEKVFPKADSRFKETAASLSPDGNTLYIVSEDPSKSLGGLDIYECTLKDEKWSKPRNLGPARIASCAFSCKTSRYEKSDIVTFFITFLSWVKSNLSFWDCVYYKHQFFHL